MSESENYNDKEFDYYMKKYIDDNIYEIAKLDPLGAYLYEHNMFPMKKMYLFAITHIENQIEIEKRLKEYQKHKKISDKYLKKIATGYRKCKTKYDNFVALVYISFKDIVKDISKELISKSKETKSVMSIIRKYVDKNISFEIKGIKYDINRIYYSEKECHNFWKIMFSEIYIDEDEEKVINNLEKGNNGENAYSILRIYVKDMDKEKIIFSVIYDKKQSEWKLYLEDFYNTFSQRINKKINDNRQVMKYKLKNDNHKKIEYIFFYNKKKYSYIKKLLEIYVYRQKFINNIDVNMKIVR